MRWITTPAAAAKICAAQAAVLETFWKCAVDNNRIGQLLSTAQFYGKILKKIFFAAVWVVENVCWITTGEDFRFACICGGAIAGEEGRRWENACAPQRLELCCE